ncbi:MAG TPA: hypothetical protein VL306_03190 [Methylomirabilota bacterium]|jgi:hypothetical protein|nr:hypothetical protein [Methylomirabilota bacterium]
MDNEEKISQELQTLQQLAQQDKKIDVASLLLDALQKQQQNLLSDKEKRWGYLISIGVPPFGLLFALKFYFSGKEDGKQAAYLCIALTVFSIVLFWFFVKVIFSSSGTSVDQIYNNTNINDIKSLYQ